MKAIAYDEMVASLSDLMHEAFKLAMDLSHSEIAPGGLWFTPRQERIGTKKEDEMVWSWADGLMHKYYQTRADGRCSLQAMLDFDISKFEEEVKENIQTMKKLLAKIGKPVVLDMKEMKRRGYDWPALKSD